VTPSTSRFDSTRRTVGLFLGPAVFAAVLALPTGLAPEAHRMAAVFALVIVLWVTEAIPLAATALLGPALTVPLGVAEANEAFAAFGNKIIFLFLGSFLIARAMTLHGLDRRIALFVLSRRWVGGRPARILLAFGAIAAFLSMWISNTATTAMMLPIGIGVLRTLPAARDEGTSRTDGYGTGLMLMIAYSCSLGGMATPVGTPPNLIALGMFERLLGREISFFDWMRFGVPVSVVAFALLYAMVLWRFRLPREDLAKAAAAIRREREGLGPWRAGEKASLVAFLLVVTLWVLPGAVSLVAGPGAPASEALKRALPEAASAIIAATTLFVLPVSWRERRFALSWREAVDIDWGTIILFGGGLSLGTLAFSTGLAEALGDVVGQWSQGLGPAAVALLALFTANILTEFMSNTAMANLLVPIFLAPGLLAAGETSVLPAIAATFGCSLAFCLPVATPPNAIVYGSGQVTLVQMLRVGVLLDIGAGLVVWGALVALTPLGLW
jgi:sodium-dependent dicarboxylate transporter 2/3/5